MAIPPPGAPLDPMEARIRFIQMDQRREIPAEEILQDRIEQLTEKTKRTISACSERLQQQQQSAEDQIDGFIEELTNVPLLQAAIDQQNSLQKTLEDLKKLNMEQCDAIAKIQPRLKENIEHKKESEADLFQLRAALRDAERHANRTEQVIIGCGERVCHRICNSEKYAPRDENHDPKEEQLRRKEQAEFFLRAQKNMDESLYSLLKAREAMNQILPAHRAANQALISGMLHSSRQGTFEREKESSASSSIGSSLMQTNPLDLFPLSLETDE